MHHRDGRRLGRGRQGQALMVAVLLMMVILLTGILFVAVVTYNQSQSGRSVDVGAAQALAEAGIRWCNTNLMKSPEGADWRPPFRAYDPSNPPNAADRSTWPVPPVMLTNGTAWGVYGPDGVADTEDDYYSEFERSRGWHGLVDATTGRYLRLGFTRIPDLNALPVGASVPAETGVVGGKGHILVRVTYDPDPVYEPEDYPADGSNPKPNPLSAAIKIESIGVVDETAPVFRYLVAYKPIGLTDYVLFVTDKDHTGRPTRLGFDPRLDMLNDNVLGWLPQTFYGPMKFNTPLELVGANSSATPNAAGASNQFVLTEQPTSATLEVPGVNPIVPGGGYLRDDKIEAQGIWEAGASFTAAVSQRDVTGTVSALGRLYPSTDPAFDTYGGRVLDGQPAMDAAGYPRGCSTLSPPEVFSPEGRARYYALTRDSGRVVLDAGTGNPVNLGTIGQGLGVYIDNNSDLQFVDDRGNHDRDALISDWMRTFHPGQYSSSNSGWNAVGTLYTPPGVEITLFPTRDAALDFGRLTAVTVPSADPSRTNPQPNEVWWPGYSASRDEPGIRITRHDHNWYYYNGTRVVDSGEQTLYLYYPGYQPAGSPGPANATRTNNQVIFAEGNVRVHGVLPARSATPGSRDYNLTIVSGGTIYIDGQILSAQDVNGRDDGGSSAPAPNSVSDERNTKLALIARDCVCLNTTRIVPQLTSGEVAAAPDDPANPDASGQHYVLSPELTGSAYSNFYFGENVLPTHNVYVVPIHTALDPGPAAIGLSVYDTNLSAGPTSSWQTHNFGGGTNPTRYYFVQPGVLAPAPNVENVFAPNWSAPSYAPSTNPTVPWDITPDLFNRSPGILKSIAISPADPNLTATGGGSTDYWVKKWKIYEAIPAAGPGGADTPTAAIHAKVNALIYAEEGCWFVIPGDYFDSRQSGAMALRYRRYNYDICVRGAITEAYHADPEMVRDWCDKWAWPIPGGGWGTIRYEYDETLRTPRDQPVTRLRIVGSSPNQEAVRDSVASAAIVPLTPQANLPRLPVLPVSKDLVFYGEGG